jgi:hypothetical protein
MDKQRSGGVVTGQTVVGEVAGATVILLDDLIASGGTLARAAGAFAIAEPRRSSRRPRTASSPTKPRPIWPTRRSTASSSPTPCRPERTSSTRSAIG